MNQKKTIKIIIGVLLMCVLVLCYYAYLSEKKLKEKETVELTEIDQLLLQNLDEDYPHSPRDVVNLYSRMITCVYNEKMEGEELTKMVKQMRKLYADEFANDAANSEKQQINGIKKELEDHPDENDQKITNYVLQEASQVDIKDVDGEKTALVEATYTIRYGNDFSKVPQVYLLVQNSDEQWKILGWQKNKGSSAIKSADNTKEED